MADTTRRWCAAQPRPRTAPVESPRASAVLHESPRTLTLNVESAKRHANVTHLACNFAPANDRDDMVGALSESCNCGTSTVFCTVVTQAPVVVQQRASQPCPRTAPVGSRRSSAQFALHTGNVVVLTTLQMCLCQQHRYSNWQGSPRWQRTLRHRGLQKLALNSGTTGGARKMRQSRQKTTPTAI